MKLYWKIVSCAFLLISLEACSSGNKSDSIQTEATLTDSLNDTTQRAQAINANVDLTGEEKTFVLTVAADGLMEVEAANLMLKRSKNREIVTFATQLLNEHEQLNTELNAIAAEKGMQLPKTLPEAMAGSIRFLKVSV